MRKGYKAYNTGKVHALYREAKNSRSGNKFEMFKSQWYVLRKVEGVKRIPAIYFMLIFAYKGFRKYIKWKKLKEIYKAIIEMEQDNNTHIVIMAGGIGSRFWPMSTPDYLSNLLM